MVAEYHRMIYFEPDDADPDLERGDITYLGNGTLLARYGGIRLLVDPCLDPDQRQATAEWDLVDAILCPYLDDDEVAPPSDIAFDREVPVITAPGLVDRLERSGCQCLHPLDTWRGIALRKGDASIAITALPGQHPTSPERPLMGSMLEFRGYPDAEPYRLYFSGGTGAVDLLDDIAIRYPRIDLGVITLACTRLDGTVVAIDARDAVRVLAKVQPTVTIPVHRVDDIFTWPHRDFRKALGSSPPSVQYLWPGNRYFFPVPARAGGDKRSKSASSPSSRQHDIGMAKDWAMDHLSH